VFINFTNEKLQSIFNDATFRKEVRATLSYIHYSECHLLLQLMYCTSVQAVMHMYIGTGTLRTYKTLSYAMMR
jgi:hypothetical protein